MCIVLLGMFSHQVQMLFRLLAHEGHSDGRNGLAGGESGLDGDILEIVGERHIGFVGWLFRYMLC